MFLLDVQAGNRRGPVASCVRVYLWACSKVFAAAVRVREALRRSDHEIFALHWTRGVALGVQSDVLGRAPVSAVVGRHDTCE